MYIDILILCKVKNGGFIMAKIIKRVGIVFFVLVISFLLILGCVFAVNTVKLDSDLGNNVDNNIQPVASKSYNLSGSCATMYNTWQEAANYSKANSGALVELTLKNDWEAVLGGSKGSSFGSTTVIEVPQGANMSLNLNSYNVDRKLSNAIDSDGYIFKVNGTFSLDDYDIATGEKRDYHYLPIGGLHDGYGQIKGGAEYSLLGQNVASAIYISYTGTFNMRGGVICNNQLSISQPSVQTKAGVVFCDGGKFNYEKGAIIDNSVDIYDIDATIAAVSWNNRGIVNLSDTFIWDNDMAGVFGSNGNLTIGGGQIEIYFNCADKGTNNYQDLVLSDYFTVSGKINCKGAINRSSQIEIYDKRSNKNNVFTSGFSTANPNQNPNDFFTFRDSSVSERFLLENGEVKYGILTNKVEKPTSGNRYITYTGNMITYYPAGYDSSTMTISGNTGTACNSYTAYVTLKNGYAWSNNSAYSLTFHWRIDPRPITKPTSGTNSFEYNGLEQTYLPSGYDSKTMNISGNTAIQVGTYTAVISRKNSNYKWSDNTTASFNLTWTITPKPIEKPIEQNKNILVFNNAEQTYIPSGFVSSQMVITGNKNTDVGEYTAKVTPNSNHKWSDNTTTAIEFKYKIIPAGVLVKEGVKYDYQYIDSNNIRQFYGNSYMHKLNDENLNIVNGVSKYVLGNIPINTSIETFLQNLYSDRNLIKIYAKESDITPIYDGLLGTRSNLSQTLATGFKVELYSNSTDTTPFDTIYLSVLGDINGDGRINASDVSYLRQVANDSTLLESMSLERQLACMINNKGGITEVDSEILRNYIGKEIDLEKFMESETANTSNAYTYLTLDRDNMLRKVSESKTNVIGNISVNTSVETLKSKLAEIGINISAMTIYNRKGEAVTDNTAIVGTGWRIEIGGEVTYLSVLGDLTGDGRITAADISYLRAIAASDTTNVQDCILLSAILLNKGGITTADSEVLKQAIKGSILLSEYNN